MKSYLEFYILLIYSLLLLLSSSLRADLRERQVVDAPPHGDFSLQLDSYTDKPGEIWVVSKKERILLPDSGFRMPKAFISPYGEWILIENHNTVHSEIVCLYKRASISPITFTQPYPDLGFSDRIWDAFEKTTGIPQGDNIKFVAWISRNVVRVALSNPMESMVKHPSGTYHSIDGWLMDCDLENATFNAAENHKDHNLSAVTEHSDSN
jgi:hypothetical protein